MDNVENELRNIWITIANQNTTEFERDLIEIIQLISDWNIDTDYSVAGTVDAILPTEYKIMLQPEGKYTIVTIFDMNSWNTLFSATVSLDIWYAAYSRALNKKGKSLKTLICGVTK